MIPNSYLSNYLTYGEPYDYASLSHGNNRLYSVNDSWTLVSKSSMLN